MPNLNEMNNKAVIILILILVSKIALAQKFVPEDGKCIVFIGQDLQATGGLNDYHNGYTDYFKTPAGVTVYTNLSPGGESFGYYNKGLDGIKNKANWGAGDIWADLYLRDSTYQNSAIAIGLSFVNQCRLLKVLQLFIVH